MARYVSEFGQGCEKVTLRQAGLMKRELTETMPPSNKDRAEKAIARDAIGVFATFPKYTFPEDKRGGNKGIVWINADPNKGLTGATQEDYYSADSVEAMDRIYRERRGVKAQKYSHLGMRGKQNVRIINRVMARKAIWQSWMKRQLSKLGKLKASFAVDWDLYGPKGHRPPKWVMQHVESGEAKGRSVFQPGNSPSFTIISNAKGCESIGAKSAAVQAIINRIAKMRSELARLARREKDIEQIE
jgi:hypothetical protein